MKKTLLALILGFAMTAAISENVQAEGQNEVKYGTAVVDGILDDKYTSSGSIQVTSDDCFWPWGDPIESELDATVYLLWDENYLYIAGDVKDSTPTARGEGANWQNDSLELWFLDEDLKYAIHSAGDGNFFLKGDADGMTPYDFAGATSAAVMGDAGYVVEYALPLNDLAAGREFGFSVQANDIVAADGANGEAIGSQEADNIFVCVENKTAVNYGTATVDGVLDRKYTESGYVRVTSADCFWPWGDPIESELDATVYLLWDEDYLYIAGDVKDSTPTARGEGANWQNDSLELWFLDEELKYAIHSAGDGNFFLKGDGDGITPYDFAGATSAAVMGDAGYVVEYALPLNDLAAGREFGFSVQANDIVAADGANGEAIGSQAADNIIVLKADDSVKTTVNYGTATVDGVLDRKYTESGYVRVTSADCFWPWGEPITSKLDATVYLLWDENYLYIAGDVKDSTPTARGEGANWQNDSLELWFLDEDLKYAIHSAGDGNFFLKGDADGMTPYDFAGATSAAVMGDAGYVVEYALPLNDLAAGREFGFSVQANDIVAADGANGEAIGSQEADNVFVLQENNSVKPIVKNGTPTVDGVLDDMYLESGYVRVTSADCFWPWGEPITSKLDATVYLLWDEDYLYIAGDVKDSTPTARGEGANWQNDSLELWFLDEDLKYAIHSAGDGNFFLKGDADGMTPYDFAGATSAAVMGDAGYVVEYALPLNDLAAGREFGFSVQANDIVAADGANGEAIGSQEADNIFVLEAGEEEVVQPSEEDKEVVDPVVDEKEEKSNVGLIVIGALVVLLGGGAAVFASKKKKAK